MLHFEPKDLPQVEVHRMMIGGIGPRPIALVSSLSDDGKPNLTPLSFFNMFGSNPPVIAFSPTRRRDSSFKDTYNNLIKTKECTVQAVTYSMVEQISLASAEFAPDVNEFEKSGLTPIDSDVVKPQRVKESPFQMECKVLDLMSYGDGGSSANIFICEVLKFHIAEDIFRDEIIHPQLIDLVARMSANYYSRAFGDAIIEVKRPVKKGIGVDNLPSFIKESNVYTGNNLGRLGNIEKIPSEDEVDNFIREIRESKLENYESDKDAFFRYHRDKNYRYALKLILDFKNDGKLKIKHYLELTAKDALDSHDDDFGWKTALYAGRF